MGIEEKMEFLSLSGLEEEANLTPAYVDEVEYQRKRHLSVIFIGNVDAGKSTVVGQILFLTGQVDDQTIQEYLREANDKGRESCYLAYIMDTDEEERVKGNTIEVGRAHFETETTRFTILDAPGHTNYVPYMICGASQADTGVLVISAREGEFESGYGKDGKTREHVHLVQYQGVSNLLVVVNKMDDPTVNWDKERFDKIESEMRRFLNRTRFRDVQFLPISGLHGLNMKTRVGKSICSWWNGPCLFEALDAIYFPAQNPDHPLRMPIFNRYEDMGTFIMGKIQSGSICEGDHLMVMPGETAVEVISIFYDEDRVRRVGPGENVRVMITGIEEEDSVSGSVLCNVEIPLRADTEFFAQLLILNLPDQATFTTGYKAVLHTHAIAVDCEIVDMVVQIDRITHGPRKITSSSVKKGALIVCRIQVNRLICINWNATGLILRSKGTTVALGKAVSRSFVHFFVTRSIVPFLPKTYRML